MPAFNSLRLRFFGGQSPNNARWMSAELKRPARRTPILPPSSSHSRTEPGPMPSFRRTSTETEICPCAVSLECAIAMPYITRVMEGRGDGGSPSEISLVGAFPFGAGVGLHGGQLEGIAHHGAHGGEIGEFARAHGLHQDVADGGGLAWPGDYAAAGAIGHELIEQRVARAAAHDVDDLDLAAGEGFQVLHHVAVAQGETFQDGAGEFAIGGGRRLAGAVAVEI